MRDENENLIEEICLCLSDIFETFMSEVDKLIKDVNELLEDIRDKFIESIKGEMTWARFRYDGGLYNYTERVEFADYYFKLNDILEELYNIDKYKIGEIANLMFEMEEAYSDLKKNVDI